MPAEDLERLLATLKERLLKDSEFNETVKYFLDHLGEHDWFHSKKYCHRSKAEKLKAIVHRAVGEFLNEKPARIFDELYFRTRGTPFYHGNFRTGPYFCHVLFFDDINSGLITLIRLGDPMTHTLRLTGFELGTGPIWN